jgi:hypothetical protein
MTRTMRPFWPLLVALLAMTTATASARHTITIRMPRVTVPAQSNIEVCYFVRIPATTPFMLGSSQIAHIGAKGGTQPQHGLMYVYTGEQLAGFPSKQPVLSRGCLDLGPDDRDHRVLFASGSAPKVVRALPTGVALELPAVPDAPGGPAAGIGILIDANWANTESSAKKVSTKLVLRPAPKHRIHRVARLVSDRSADAAIFVPPFTRHSTAELMDTAWAPAGNACVLGLSGQMHRRGRCIGVDLVDATGHVKPPASGLPNPCEPDRRTQLFVGADFTDPGALAFSTPIAVRQGEALRYACWTDNGSSAGTSVRLGCEQSPGVVPGAVDSPAAACSIVLPASPECGGVAACTYANAVAGPNVDDEVCGLTALVYDAAADGTCDVSTAP